MVKITVAKNDNNECGHVEVNCELQIEAIELPYYIVELEDAVFKLLSSIEGTLNKSGEPDGDLVKLFAKNLIYQAKEL